MAWPAIIGRFLVSLIKLNSLADSGHPLAGRGATCNRPEAAAHIGWRWPMWQMISQPKGHSDMLPPGDLAIIGRAVVEVCCGDRPGQPAIQLKNLDLQELLSI